MTMGSFIIDSAFRDLERQIYTAVRSLPWARLFSANMAMHSIMQP